MNNQTSTVLFIGDPHFQVSNLQDVNIFIPEVVKLAKERKPDIILVAGDLLHTHERLHTTVLNKAYEFIDEMRKITRTYVLVGNHDYISNTQFLSTNHWMNSLKEWDGVEIVDSVVDMTHNGNRFVMVPYVYPGRFKEAIATKTDNVDSAACIFAHQEFKGCKMGAIVSEHGDEWGIDMPLVVSGHIHSKQRPQSNVYYPGTPMQIAFGESEDNIVPLFTFKGGKLDGDAEEIRLNLPGKSIIYMDADSLKEYLPPPTGDKVRITLSGEPSDFKSLRQTKKYKDLVESGVKIVFKATKDERTGEQRSDIAATDFMEILNTMVTSEKNIPLLEAYDLIVHNRESCDVFFL
jgi:DNA repair exonuclease SbcCD nuclease subunit